MVRAIALCLMSSLLATGCGQPPPLGSARLDLNGGQDLVEVETTEGGTSLTFQSSGGGQAVTQERYDLSWAESRQLRIENGQLTVDEVDRGPLKPGDRITLRQSGEVLVKGPHPVGRTRRCPCS